MLERALHRLRDRIAEVADLDFNYEAFDGESADASAVVAAANTLPFASERRLVIVRDVDRMNAAGQAVLAEYARDPAPSACVVLVAKRMRKDSKLFKAVQALGGVSEYPAPKRSEYPSWVVDLFAARGRRISYDGATALVLAVGRDLRRLETETEKVLAYAGERVELTRDDVVSVVAETAPVSVFDFLNAVGARDCPAALTLLGDLLADGQDLMGVHAMTVRQLRTLVSARALVDRGASPGEIMREVGMAEWQAKAAMAQARRFTTEELSRALRDAATLEGRIKSGQGEPRLLFELWLTRACASAS
ncbi:MAG: DNA polymerase III subunit delta [Coriobacteriia bacterium]|nr:DNA polymerase III subunit delta [Coriobacteriia bacterium]